MIATYDMDHKIVAGTTMQKLINAAKRGVKVYLIVDDLNFYVEPQLIKKLQAAGGVCINNAPFEQVYSKYFFRKKGRMQRFFRRNH